MGLLEIAVKSKWQKKEVWGRNEEEGNPFIFFNQREEIASFQLIEGNKIHFTVTNMPLSPSTISILYILQTEVRYRNAIAFHSLLCTRNLFITRRPDEKKIYFDYLKIIRLS